MDRTLLVVLALTLAACSPPRPEPKETAGPSYAYRVELSFTPRALDRLAQLGEKVVIASVYFGRAGEAAKGAVEQAGLGESTLQVEPVNQIVRVSVSPFEADRLAQIDGEPMVRIDVFTARTSGAGNLIRCGTFEGRFAAAQAAPIAIACDLIEPEIILAPETPRAAGEP